jgi:saccharopine dehydrogenase-like NADP-dependent oxidoreductase
MGFRVLIVGCGAQGRVISAHMARVREVDEIKLSDKNVKVCRQHAKWLQSDKVSVHKVDASNVGDVASLAKGVDVVINAVTPEYNLNIMDAALKSGANYIDLAFGPPYENIDKEFERDDKFKDGGLTAITGAGTSPGLTNVLAACAVDQLDRVNDIFIRLYNSLEAKEPITTWSPRTIIEDSMLKPVIFENGKFKEVPPFSGEEIYIFPEPIGAQTVWFHMHEEPLMFGRTMKDKGLKNCNLKMGALAGIKSLFDRGILSDKPVTIRGVNVAPWEVVAATLPSPPTPEELKQKIESGIIIDSRAVAVVDVRGEKDNKEQRIVLWAFYPSIKEVVRTFPVATHTSYMTGINGALLAKMLGKGEITSTGVITPELLEQEVRHKYLAELAKQEPPILAYQRVEKRIN